MTRITPIAVAILATGALTGAAIAAEQLKEVTVQAARMVETAAGRTQSGIPIVNASVSYGVSYADLDLSLPSGVKTLEKRINDTALKACEQLRNLYPVTANPAPSDAECAKTAAAKALATVIHK
jgi:UrcA family protein